MITENNWLQTNIKEKSMNNSIDYRAKISKYVYEKLSFNDAAENAASKILKLDVPIYIAFSGGADSEYVVRLFHKMSIPFTCVTVITSGNKYELEYAYYIYRKFPDIKKIFIDISNPKDFISRYKEIIQTFNTSAINSVGAVEAARYVKQQQGIMITGDHFIGYNYDENQFPNVEISEWDCYYDVLVDNQLVIPFFIYDLPIAHSIVSSFTKQRTEDFKETMYNISFRAKFKTHFEGTQYNQVIQTLSAKSEKTGKKEDIYTKEEFLELIK